MKRVDLGVFRFVQAVQAGTLVPGHDFVFDLKNGGVAARQDQPEGPAAYKARLAQLQSQIIDRQDQGRRPSPLEAASLDVAAERRATCPPLPFP